MAPKEVLALRLLMDNPQGLYGSEFVHLSNGALTRGSIYTLIDRLVNKGLVREVDEEPTPELEMKRTRHFITRKEVKAGEAFAAGLGLSINRGVFAR